MIGTSALIVSVSFLICSITPVYATNPIPTNLAGSNGYTENGIVYFISNGYFYKIKVGHFERAFKSDGNTWSHLGWGELKILIVRALKHMMDNLVGGHVKKFHNSKKAYTCLLQVPTT